MKGFLRDYIINYEHLTENKKKATEKEWKLAMGGFSPDMLPVFSTLAKNFAVYDHWHCAVPSQTFCNRSFFHASTSHGYVTNRGDGGYDKWLDGNAYAPTVFNRLEDAGISWRVYYDAAQLVSMTGVLHAPATQKYWKSNFRTLDQFYMDAESGNLPAYSFIEPRMVFNHNDMHPPYGVLREGSDGEGGVVTDGAISDVRAGDALLHFIYAAVRESKSEKGSNALNTMLLVTFDEHGGTYDHVPPPAGDPPGDGKRGEMGFGFDRLGCRVPAIAISAYTAKNTIINDPMHHGSVIATLSRQHGLEPLTFRDQSAPDLFNAINLKTPRPASEWPTTVPNFVPHNPDEKLDPNAPEHRGKKLSNPARGLLGLLIAKFGRRDEVAPDTYQEAFKALALHGTGLFGTLDEAPLEQPE
jgi:phospholipase C